jgi:hypothetical protein
MHFATFRNDDGIPESVKERTEVPESTGRPACPFGIKGQLNYATAHLPPAENNHVVQGIAQASCS